MKRVIVRLNGGLERYVARQCRVVVEVDEDATLATLQERLGIPKGEVGLFVLNQQLRNEDALVLDGSTVDLYPAFAGG